MKFRDKRVLKKLQRGEVTIVDKRVWLGCIDTIARSTLDLARVKDTRSSAHWIALHLQELMGWPRRRAPEVRERLENEDVDEAGLLELIASLPDAVETARDQPGGRSEDNFWAGDLETVTHVDMGSPYGDFAVTLSRAPNGRRAELNLVGPAEVAEALMSSLTSEWGERWWEEKT